MNDFSLQEREKNNKAMCKLPTTILLETLYLCCRRKVAKCIPILFKVA
jgi:hypothetical protein